MSWDKFVTEYYQERNQWLVVEDKQMLEDEVSLDEVVELDMIDWCWE